MIRKCSVRFIIEYIYQQWSSTITWSSTSTCANIGRREPRLTSTNLLRRSRETRIELLKQPVSSQDPLNLFVLLFLKLPKSMLERFAMEEDSLLLNLKEPTSTLISLELSELQLITEEPVPVRSSFNWTLQDSTLTRVNSFFSPDVRTSLRRVWSTMRPQNRLSQQLQANK